MIRLTCAAVLLCATAALKAPAQWTIQDSHTTADLRGIHALGNGVAWASGTEGTVLRTTNDGKDWQRCTTPPDADHLDFRGIQAFDASTAIVMSSGKGPLSRLYKTTDACHTWKLIFKNPEEDGFWDAVKFDDRDHGMLLGDPVHGAFYLAETHDGGKHWIEQHNKGLRADARTQGVFAASNSSLVEPHDLYAFGSGGLSGAFVSSLKNVTVCLDDCPESELNLDGHENVWQRKEVPLGHKSETSGLFSLASGPKLPPPAKGLVAPPPNILVAVGGDYLKPDEFDATATFTTDRGERWLPATTPPHGYRSSVAYDPTTKTWITVGPNGTDISTDDGRNWRPLRPASTDAPDADQHWNALSLPFVVGPHGRVGKLNPQALSTGH